MAGSYNQGGPANSEAVAGEQVDRVEWQRERRLKGVPDLDGRGCVEVDLGLVAVRHPRAIEIKKRASTVSRMANWAETKDGIDSDLLCLFVAGRVVASRGRGRSRSRPCFVLCAMSSLFSSDTFFGFNFNRLIVFRLYSTLFSPSWLWLAHTGSNYSVDVQLQEARSLV